MKWSDRLLAGFDRWFTSGIGVWQTVIVTTAVVLLEQLHVINSHRLLLKIARKVGVEP